MIDNSKSNAFTDEPFFNTDFIKRNKIKSITGKVSSKRELQPIVDNGVEYYFEFDSAGNTTMILSSYISYNSKDSIIVTFEYDDRGNIITRRRNDSHGFYSYTYEFDSLNRVIKETYNRDENCGPNRFRFKLGQQFAISTEYFTYADRSEKEKIQQFHNYYGNIYQEKIKMYDSLNYLTEEITRLTLSGRESKIQYAYDEKGRLSKKTDISEFIERTENTNAFQYDDFGNLTEEQIYRNDKQITLRSMIYDKSTLLLTATVAKDISTEIITIVKYSYDFYP